MNANSTHVSSATSVASFVTPTTCVGQGSASAALGTSRIEATPDVVALAASSANVPIFPRLPHEMDESSPTATNDYRSPTRDQGLREQRGPGPEDSPVLSCEAIEYLKVNKALEIPEKSFLDDCIQSYFSYVHPFLPVIEKSVFLRAYNSWDQPSEPLPSRLSLLLLQSMAFAASRVSRLCITIHGSICNDLVSST
jgi:hypothetical protein